MNSGSGSNCIAAERWWWSIGLPAAGAAAAKVGTWTDTQAGLMSNSMAGMCLADAWRLSPDDGRLDSPFRLGRFHCAAALVLVGSRLAEAGGRLLAESARLPIAPASRLLEAGSPIPHGIVLRLLGETPEQVGRRLTDRLSFLATELGEAPWSRKW